MAALAEALLDALPQTQCRRCGYADCRGYAEALADVDRSPLGDAARVDVNRCPPGGAAGIERLARLLERPVLPLDPRCGREAPRALAVIDESSCIGCALCLAACPVDAIVGAAKRMHTVVDVQCTGCELCIPVCPVDCISLVPANDDRTGWAAWSAEQATRARERYARRRARLDGDAGRVAASDAVAGSSGAAEGRGPAGRDGGAEDDVQTSEADARTRHDLVAVALARARNARAPR